MKLERWLAEKGTLPERVSELVVEQFLPMLPMALGKVFTIDTETAASFRGGEISRLLGACLRLARYSITSRNSRLEITACNPGGMPLGPFCFVLMSAF